MYIFRTTSNRQPKRKSPETTGAVDNNKENVTPEIKDEAGGPKKPLHKLPPAPNKQAKYTRKMQDHDMTKEVLASLLATEEDEIEITFSGYVKHIKKNLCPEAQEDCLMELGEVINRYIRAARMNKNTPSATVSAPVASNENIVPMQPNMDCNYRSIAPPQLMKMGAGDVGTT